MPSDATIDPWQQRAARYQRLSALFHEDRATAPLSSLAAEMQREIIRPRDLTEVADNVMRYNAVLVAQLDHALACVRGNRLPARPFSGDDLREATRLCIEEAKSAVDLATRRSLSARAFDLAQVAEMICRTETSPPATPAVAEEMQLSDRIVGHLRRMLAEGDLEGSYRQDIEKLLEQELARLIRRR
jgi:hypothetical protein